MLLSRAVVTLEGQQPQRARFGEAATAPGGGGGGGRRASKVATQPLEPDDIDIAIATNK